ncbi:MAG: low-specificity L-threonine aldolase [Calditrichaeota bacterium]|nr:MAG: low-specificity L-threonine aldolase [Calditrichota bacterium]
MRVVDLRSDTVTRPSAEMRQVMMTARVGDDVFGEDPTVNQLQEMVAEMTGKEAALFVTSGTQGNQVCINAHTRPGEEVIVERGSHIFNYECGSPALLSGVQLYPIDGKHGAFTLEQVEQAVRPPNVHHPQTRLICIENTHNRAGGTIFPLEEMARISQFARQRGLRMHLDGARLWNASVATGISIREYCQYFDSVSMCFSKGLGCPVGSIVAGDRDFIQRAHYYRKAYGGGLRQAGVLAAAAIYAIENNFSRLEEDHRKARLLAEGLSQLPGVKLDLETVQTNIVIFDLDEAVVPAERLVALLREQGVLVLNIAPGRIRAVTHLDVSMEDVAFALEACRQVWQQAAHV